MPRFIQKVSKKTGLPPGTIVSVGTRPVGKTKITVFDFDQNNYQEKEISTIEECFPFKDTPTITWINIDDLQVDIIEKIDTHFGIHPLVLEDIVNTAQRPKMEDFEDYIFIVLKMLYKDQDKDEIIAEQVSFILGPNYVISFQEKPGGDVFDPIRDRIRNYKGRVRKMGADYLAYVLIDCVVDHYFIILENLDEKIEQLEEILLKDIKPEFSQRIHQLKRDIIFLLKQVWPLREVVSGLQRTESKLIKKTTVIYLRDLYDHSIRVIENIETFRDLLAGLHDIYLSSLSNKMNEIMKVLTIISTIFIPIMFIASVYGMNFKHMPELEWPMGYFVVLVFMGIIGLSMVIYFKKRKWI